MSRTYKDRSKKQKIPVDTIECYELVIKKEFKHLINKYTSFSYSISRNVFNLIVTNKTRRKYKHLLSILKPFYLYTEHNREPVSFVDCEDSITDSFLVDKEFKPSHIITYVYRLEAIAYLKKVLVPETGNLSTGHQERRRPVYKDRRYIKQSFNLKEIYEDYLDDKFLNSLYEN